MRRLLPIVDRLRVRTPCEVDWETMDAREDGQRYCAQCTRVVHDVATMTRAEAIALATALDRGERICRRVSRRRSDGAILTAEGFLVAEAPSPRTSNRLLAMATAGALAACAGPEMLPTTHAAANQPGPLVIAPLPPHATATTPQPETHAIPAHARGEAPETEVLPPFPAPAVVAPIGPPAPPKKEKPVPPTKAKPVKPHRDLEIDGGY